MTQKEFESKLEQIRSKLSSIVFHKGDVTRNKYNDRLLSAIERFITFKEIALKRNCQTSIINHVDGSTLALTNLLILVETHLSKINKNQELMFRGHEKIDIKKMEQLLKEKQEIQNVLLKATSEISLVIEKSMKRDVKA